MLMSAKSICHQAVDKYVDSLQTSAYLMGVGGKGYHPPNINLILPWRSILPSTVSFKKGCCQLQAKVCARSTG